MKFTSSEAYKKRAYIALIVAVALLIWSIYSLIAYRAILGAIIATLGSLPWLYIAHYYEKCYENEKERENSQRKSEERMKNNK